MTDGIGISVIKQNFDMSKGGTSNPKSSLVEEEEFKYILNKSPTKNFDLQIENVHSLILVDVI
ncbi:hypothetical protein BD770DRAFT_397885 [Pilaira anomala]|nr:hypothetical protein BD770DRAFT_397885 [Pilaira anomala]